MVVEDEVMRKVTGANNRRKQEEIVTCGREVNVSIYLVKHRAVKSYGPVPVEFHLTSAIERSE